MVLPGPASDAGCRGAKDVGLKWLSVDPPTISGNSVLPARLSLLVGGGVSEFTVGKFVCRDGLVLILVRQGLEEVEEFISVPM